MKYSILLTICMLASIIRPVAFYNFMKSIIHEESPYRSGIFLLLDGILFLLFLAEVFSKL